MKSLFTLLLTCMISLSLMGQHDIKDLKKQRQVKKHHNSFNALGKRMSRDSDHAPKPLMRQSRNIQNAQLKSVNADMQKMDSIMYEDYDVDADEWIVTDKDVFTYDDQGNMIQYEWHKLDTVTMKLKPEWKEELTFDANGNITLYLGYEWDESSDQWVIAEKWEDTFDGDGNPIKEIWSVWDSDTEQWVQWEQYEWTYDIAGKMTSELGSYWDTWESAWIPFWKYEYTYIEDEVSQILETYYNPYTSQWINNYRTTATFNGAFKVESELTEEWDTANNVWVNWAKYEYTWDAQGRNTVEVEYEWDEGSSVWLNYMKYEYTYDEHGNTTEEVWLEWYDEQWYNYWRGVWVYNLLYTYQSLLVPYWYLPGELDFEVYHMPLSLTGYWPELAAWILWWRMMFYFSAFSPTEVQDIEKGMVNIYPNPASDYLTVSWDDDYTHLDFEIIDLAGRQVIFRSVDNNETINLSQLSRGLYLCKLSDTRNVIYTGKISLK